MTAALSDEQYQQLRNDLKEEVVAEVKRDIHNELSTLTSSEGEVEVRSDDDSAALGDVWIADIPVGTLLSNALQNSSDALKGIRNGSSAENSEGSDGDDGSNDDGMTPMERLLRGEERDDWFVGKATESVERAKELFRHFDEWSSKTPKGRVIKTSGGKRGTSTLKNLLNAVLDGPEISWKQVYRACSKLEEWTKGRIEFEDNSRHGKMLVMNGPSSSVAKGG